MAAVRFRAVRWAATAAALTATVVATSVASGAVEFRFGAAGDFGTGNSFRATVHAVQHHNPDFMIALGDLTQSATGEEGWCRYWKDYLTTTRLLILSGNHDTGIDRYVAFCGNPFASAIDGLYPWQYYFDYPSARPIARFIMVSPGIGRRAPIPTDYAAGTPGYAFTAAAIDDARAKGLEWIVVGMHKNYISTFEKRNEVSVDAGRTFMTMLFDRKVDLILQGHEHGYARTKQLTTNPSTCPLVPVDAFDQDCVADDDDDLRRGAGTVIMVASMGGKSMRLVEPSDLEHPYFVNRFRDRNHETFGYAEFTVTPAVLSFSFVRSGGPMFQDSFRISAAPLTSAPQEAPDESGHQSSSSRARRSISS